MKIYYTFSTGKLSKIYPPTKEREKRIKNLAKEINKYGSITAKKLRKNCGYGDGSDSSFNCNMKILREMNPQVTVRVSGSKATYYIEKRNPDSLFVNLYPDRLPLDKLKELVDNQKKMEDYLIELLIKVHWPFTFDTITFNNTKWKMLFILVELEYLIKNKEIIRMGNRRVQKKDIIDPESNTTGYKSF